MSPSTHCAAEGEDATGFDTASPIRRIGFCREYSTCLISCLASGNICCLVMSASVCVTLRVICEKLLYLTFNVCVCP